MTSPHPYQAPVEEALDAHGASEALAEVLEAQGDEELPREPDALVAFLLGPLQDALVGRLHPATAEQIVEELAERLVRREASNEAPTVPPPAAGADADYVDLASGAIHTRETPTWGLARPSSGGISVWLLVTEDESLLDMARATAPELTEAVVASSLAIVRATLGRDVTVSVVIDATRPSVPLRELIAVLTDESAERVLLWRMPQEERAKLGDAVPFTKSWMGLGADVDVGDLVRLLAS